MSEDSRCGGTYRLKGERGTKFMPEHTALLVIDPVNDFLSEGGADWDMTRSTVQKHDVVGHLQTGHRGAAPTPHHLARLGIIHLVISGMTTNLCCESTGRHAMEHGYDVTFLRDAIGADTRPRSG